MVPTVVSYADQFVVQSPRDWENLKTVEDDQDEVKNAELESNGRKSR